MEPIVVPSHIPEEFVESMSPADNARLLAEKKAEEIGRQFNDAIVIGADTVVVLDGLMLGKPDDEADARRMLRLLSGRTHTVITAFALLDTVSNGRCSEYESTLVTFRNLPAAEIEAYVAGGSPMDKAGAYGIQDDYGAVFVTRIEGCFYNVVGFPLAKFHTALQRFYARLIEQQGHVYVEKN